MFSIVVLTWYYFYYYRDTYHIDTTNNVTLRYIFWFGMPDGWAIGNLDGILKKDGGSFYTSMMTTRYIL